jgi:ribonuclease HI
MKAEDICLDCTEKADKVYIDGSATKIGASAYAGWGMWSPDNANFKGNGPLKGKDQGSDRAEVRALLAALEKSTGRIEVITDNQYVRDTTNYLLSGGIVHKGKHSDLWHRIYDNFGKLISIRWVKAHLKQEKATAAGVSYEDWYGNDQADEQAKAGAEKHGYTRAQKFVIAKSKSRGQNSASHAQNLYQVHQKPSGKGGRGEAQKDQRQQNRSGW